jgi:hypothetical protein
MKRTFIFEVFFTVLFAMLFSFIVSKLHKRGLKDPSKHVFNDDDLFVETFVTTVAVSLAVRALKIPSYF